MLAALVIMELRDAEEEPEVMDDERAELDELIMLLEEVLLDPMLLDEEVELENWHLSERLIASWLESPPLLAMHEPQPGMKEEAFEAPQTQLR